MGKRLSKHFLGWLRTNASKAKKPSIYIGALLQELNLDIDVRNHNGQRIDLYKQWIGLWEMDFSLGTIRTKSTYQLVSGYQHGYSNNPCRRPTNTKGTLSTLSKPQQQLFGHRIEPSVRINARKEQRKTNDTAKS